MRVKRGTTHARKRRRVLTNVKGYRWGRKNRIRLATTAILKAGVHAYRDRKRRKGNFRKLWQIQINAAARTRGTTYSRLLEAMKKGHVTLNRKMLADLANNEPKAFAAVVDTVLNKR